MKRYRAYIYQYRKKELVGRSYFTVTDTDLTKAVELVKSNLIGTMYDTVEWDTIIVSLLGKEQTITRLQEAPRLP